MKNGFPTRATPRASRASSPRSAPTVVYFGKLIENKGVQVLLEAIAGLDARAVVVGFGDFREQLEALAPLGTLFTGALEHRHLRHLLPLCDVAVVPSIFPEAFGMVAAEAAAAGVLPVVSAHSGLAEVAAGIGEEVGPEAAALLSFPAGDAAALRERLRGDPRAARRAQARAGCRRAPRRRATLELAGRRRAAGRNFNRISRLFAWARSSGSATRRCSRISRESFDAVPDFTVAVEEEFALLDPETLDLVNRFEELQEAALGTALEPASRRRADRVGDRDPHRTLRLVRGCRRASG